MVEHFIVRAPHSSDVYAGLEDGRKGHLPDLGRGEYIVTVKSGFGDLAKSTG